MFLRSIIQNIPNGKRTHTMQSSNTTSTRIDLLKERASAEALSFLMPHSWYGSSQIALQPTGVGLPIFNVVKQ